MPSVLRNMGNRGRPRKIRGSGQGEVVKQRSPLKSVGLSDELGPERSEELLDRLEFVDEVGGDSENQGVVRAKEEIT
ncbi:hypothetical protein Dimus_003988, partial [Dionaea muscipula]